MKESKYTGAGSGFGRRMNGEDICKPVTKSKYPGTSSGFGRCVDVDAGDIGTGSAALNFTGGGTTTPFGTPFGGGGTTHGLFHISQTISSLSLLFVVGQLIVHLQICNGHAAHFDFVENGSGVVHRNSWNTLTPTRCVENYCVTNISEDMHENVWTTGGAIVAAVFMIFPFS